ncbi:MAG: hypothetical protein DSY37_02900 [Hyperthermus sp.]|nr:MAG: hypothetical protein DSY37_02900 [Hyperthermus sp.]
MSLQWEPEWVEEVLEYSGVRIRVFRDKATGLIACPVCGLGDNASYFFMPRDLLEHLRAHARRADKYRFAVVESEEE